MPSSVPSPPPGPSSMPIPPQHVWMLLSVPQQQEVLQQIVTVCQHLLANSARQREARDAGK